MNLKKETEDILYGGDNFHMLTQGIDILYKKLSTATSFFIGDLTYERLIETPNGKVVTPVRAALCLKDIARTTYFLRAINKAIEHYLQTQKEVRILYAGCGPYATLLTPFTSLFSSEQIRFTFLEINEFSFDTVTELYKKWNLNHYLDEVRHEDATNPAISFSEAFHIIISETMQMGLKNECQVPITRNLVRFLTPDGTFIPECISLDIYLTDSFNPLDPDAQKKQFLGNAYKLDFRRLPASNHKKVIEMVPSELNRLQLFTEIFLFGDERLRARQSGLSLPLTLDRFRKKKPSKIEFTYNEGSEPGLSFKYQY